MFLIIVFYDGFSPFYEKINYKIIVCNDNFLCESCKMNHKKLFSEKKWLDLNKIYATFKTHLKHKKWNCLEEEKKEDKYS